MILSQNLTVREAVVRAGRGATKREGPALGVCLRQLFAVILGVSARGSGNQKMRNEERVK